MKTIITTVGASLFLNYMKDDVINLIGDDYINISKDIKKIDEFEKNITKNTNLDQSYINNIKKTIQEFWIIGIHKDNNGNWSDKKDNNLNIHASAEITSLFKIQELLNEEVNVIFIITDTILSPLAAEIIKDNLPQGKFKVTNSNRIGGLQVYNFDKFQDGMNELIRQLAWIILYDLCLKKISKENKNSIKQVKPINDLLDLKLDSIFDSLKNKPKGKQWEDYFNEIAPQILTAKNNEFILNISGGYKSIIPILTLMGQLYNCDLNYIYEDSEEIIQIKKLPINFDISFIEFLLPFLDQYRLDKISTENENQCKDILAILINRGIIQKVNNNFKLTFIGELLRIYSRVNLPTDSSALGTYYEFIIFMFYYNLKQFSNIIRGKELVPDEQNKLEVDIYLEKENEVTFIEAKSYYLIYEDQDFGFPHVKDQIKKRIECWKNQNKNQLHFILSIWKTEFDEMEIVKAKLNNFKNELNHDYNDKNFKLTFEVNYYHFKVTISENNWTNPFGSFFPKTSEKIEINTLELSL